MTRPSDIPESVYEWAAIFCDDNINTPDIDMVARAFMAGQGAVAVPTRVGLTPMQSSVLAFVEGFQEERGYAPAYREIAEGVGLASKSGVHRLVHDLVARGALQLMPGHCRSGAVVGRA